MIVLGSVLEGWARRRFDDVLEGRLGLQQLEWPLADLYHLGFFDGQASLADALSEAESAADRYYRRAFDKSFRAPSIPSVSYADLCRIRGEADRARAAEEDLAQRFARSSDAA